MRRNSKRIITQINARREVIFAYASLLMAEGKEKAAESYKDREHMTVDEIRAAKAHINEVRILRITGNA